MFNVDEIDDEYAIDNLINMQLNSYVTTTLITKRNITLADILITVFDNQEFEELEKSLMRTLH
jgi:hypothetical protein